MGEEQQGHHRFTPVDDFHFRLPPPAPPTMPGLSCPTVIRPGESKLVNGNLISNEGDTELQIGEPDEG